VEGREFDSGLGGAGELISYERNGASGLVDTGKYISFDTDACTVFLEGVVNLGCTLETVG